MWSHVARQKLGRRGRKDGRGLSPHAFLLFRKERPINRTVSSDLTEIP